MWLRALGQLRRSATWLCIAGSVAAMLLAPLLRAQAPFRLPSENFPSEPLEFPPLEPQRPNAIDLLAGPNGYAFVRYQRTVSPQFSLLFDLSSYLHYANVFHLLTAAQRSGTINLDFRAGAGLGLAWWPQQPLRQGYLALRSQIQLQLLRASYAGNDFNYSRFVVGNNLEVGVRMGRKVAAAVFFGGLGFQVPTNAETYLPIGFSLPLLYAYFGLGMGLTFR